MKRFLAICTAAVLLICCTKVDDDIVLTFKADGAGGQSVTLVAHSSVIPVVLDGGGYGECVLTGMDAVYARVYYGQSMKMLYLEGGDRAGIAFDSRDFSGTFSFEGDKAPAVNYLNSVLLTPLPDESYALGLEEFVSRLQKKEKEAVKLMKANNLRSCGKFGHMEKGRIRYSFGNMLLMYPVGHALMSGDQAWKPGEDYYDEVRKYLVEDEDWVGLTEYRNFMVELAHVLDDDASSIKGAYPKAVAQLEFIADEFGNRRVREVLINYLAASYVDFHGIDNIQDLLNIHNTYVSDPRLVEEFRKKYDKWDRARPGKRSPDFEAVDVDGRQWTLADFKGKYVYIDLWATWCNPCKREFPYLKELEQEFEGRDIVFLGLSVDGSREKWESMLGKGILSGVQLYLGPQSPFQKAYNINGIPRFILLDKEGVIINPDMSRPSSPDTKAFLESLEGIGK